MFKIRLINTSDAAAALKVYAPYVLNTAISFEYDVPSVDEFKKKIEKICAQYPWLVCEHNGRIIGYAYGSTHRDRTGYQWSPESTVYLDEQYHRKGIARVLYEALFKLLKMQGYYSVYAGILSSNIKSVEFHRALGFEDIGLFKNIGYKLGEWHSNMWMQHFLQGHNKEPKTPVPFRALTSDDSVSTVLERANEKLDITNLNHDQI